MSNFNSDYLNLLQQQVNEEIHYLVNHGHDTDKIHIPCMFCYQTKNGHYRCTRLHELRQFQSSIAVNKAQNPERKKIGFAINDNQVESLDTLPLLFP